jgi:sialate O-acetylesterase
MQPDAPSYIEREADRELFERVLAGDFCYVLTPRQMGKSSDKLQSFTIAGADRKFVWAEAMIDGETVVVSSPQIDKPVAVRYAWAINPVGNLYNRAGLPASPFRTDAWPEITRTAHVNRLY